MGSAKQITPLLVVVCVVTLVSVSLADSDDSAKVVEPDKCDGTKGKGGESCGCGGAATNRHHSEDEEEGIVEDAEPENDPGGSDASKYSAAANAQSAYPRTHQMVRVEGGTFTMGTDKPGIYMDGEHPARRISINSFWMDVFEVSNAEFELFVNSTGYVTEVSCS